MPVVKIPDAQGKTIQFMEVDGVLYPYVQGANQETAIPASRDAEARNNDVILVCYPKGGTHWIWEVLKMLHNGSPETIQTIKQESMIEALSKQRLTSLPSPRVLNTHCRYKDIPRDMTEKKTKIVLIHRNPKDTAVSLYNMHKNLSSIYDYDGEWKDWLELFIEGKLEYGSWFEYVRDWEEVMENNPDQPIHLMFYEDMKQNSQQEIERLVDFLGLSVPEGLCSQIADKCQFSNMVKDKQGVGDGKFLAKLKWRDNKPGFFRKGEIGDWKNWFTVAQHERFDKLYSEQMTDSKLKFQYTGH